MTTARLFILPTMEGQALLGSEPHSLSVPLSASAGTRTHKKSKRKTRLPLINHTLSCSFHLASVLVLHGVHARNAPSDSAAECRVAASQLERNQNVSSLDNHWITTSSKQRSRIFMAFK